MAYLERKHSRIGSLRSVCSRLLTDDSKCFHAHWRLELLVSMAHAVEVPLKVLRFFKKFPSLGCKFPFCSFQSTILRHFLSKSEIPLTKSNRISSVKENTKKLTLNLKSPVGLLAYGMPLNEKKSIFLMSVVFRTPRTCPYEVSTTLNSDFLLSSPLKTKMMTITSTPKMATPKKTLKMTTFTDFMAKTANKNKFANPTTKNDNEFIFNVSCWAAASTQNATEVFGCWIRFVFTFGLFAPFSRIFTREECYCDMDDKQKFRKVKEMDVIILSIDKNNLNFRQCFERLSRWTWIHNKNILHGN